MPTIGVPEEGEGESSAVTTETQLFNDALGQAGGCQRITAIDDGSVNANHCLTFYGPLRDGLLRSHFWNFALVWKELAQITPDPTIGYAFSYQLPPDWLRTKDYAGTQPTGYYTWWFDSSVRKLVSYKIEGRTLRSNDGQAFLQYVRRVTNPAEWDAMFYQAVATLLASKLVLAIRKEPKMAMALSAEGERLLLLAMAVDGQEGSVEPTIVDDLIWGRR